MSTAVVLTPSLASSLARLDSLIEWASFSHGWPSAGDESWYRVEDFLDPAIRNAVLEYLLAGHYAGDPREVVGNYLFRAVINYPLLLAGYLFASERRVPLLGSNTMVHRAEYLDGLRLLETRAFVLPDDPLADQPSIEIVPDKQALTEALFMEVKRTCEPLIRSFRADRLVATTNAWESILDSIAGGFELAGRHDLGFDTAWRDWSRLVESCPFPARRRPRRFQYEIEGESGECWIRAGCCLWYTTARAKNDPVQRYCGSCRLMPDDERVRVLCHWTRNGMDEMDSS